MKKAVIPISLLAILLMGALSTYAATELSPSDRLSGLGEMKDFCGGTQVGIFGDVTTIITGEPNAPQSLYYRQGRGPWEKSGVSTLAHSLVKLPNGKWLIGDTGAVEKKQTEHHRLIELEDLSGKGPMITRTELAGKKLYRPHDELVDPDNGDIYVIDGNRRLFHFKELDGHVDVWTFAEKDLDYDRALSWFDGHLHIIHSSRGEVIRIDNYPEHRITKFSSPRPSKKYGTPVPKYGDYPAGALSTTGLVLNDVEKSDGWYYGTNDFLPDYAFGGDTSPARLIRWKTWEDFERGNWEDLSYLIPANDTPLVPYFITIDNGTLYTPLSDPSERGCANAKILELDLKTLQATTRSRAD